jgi:Xaa-Pro aminopeptidase
MTDVRLNRRDVLRYGTFAAGAMAVSSFKLPKSPSEQYLEPPKAARTLYSKEYGRSRIQKVQNALRRADLAALIIANRGLDYIGYVSNFHPYPLQPGLALVLADGPTFLFVNTYSSAHTRALRPVVWVDELIDVPRDAVSEGSNQNLVDFCINELRRQKLDHARIGLAGDEIEWILPYYIRGKLPSAEIVDASRTLTEMIVVKDDVEISLIRFAQRYIDEVAYPTFRRTLKAGENDQAVYAEVLGNLIAAGASPHTVLLFDAGPAGSGTWASGPRGRRLEKSDIILSEPTPAIAGYQAEKMYTFCLGRDIPESQRRGSEIVHEAYQMLMEELKPSRELTPIVEKVDTFLRRKDYEGATVPMGHWIGAQNHEGPRFTREGTIGWVLRPNMVMSWHPNIVIPGKVRTTCSTCVLITEKGVEDLSAIKMEPMYYI